jgi:hypothetical protein
MLDIDVEPTGAKAGHMAKVEPGRFEDAMPTTACENFPGCLSKKFLSMADSVFVVRIYHHDSFAFGRSAKPWNVEDIGIRLPVGPAKDSVDGGRPSPFI